MQIVSSSKWEADQKFLMVIYRLLVRSNIDYGGIVYNSVSIRELGSLESVSNEAMRIFGKCFKYTPISSLQVTTEKKNSAPDKK